MKFIFFFLFCFSDLRLINATAAEDSNECDGQNAFVQFAHGIQRTLKYR